MIGPASWKLDLWRVALVAYWVGLLIVFLALRAKHLEVILDDESIPVKVAEAMRARGSLDPNWRFADLPQYFRYDQYNFYLYNVVARAVIKVGAWLHLAAVVALRWANVPFQLLALALTVDAARRIGAGRFAIALAGALIALAPGMVQDASLARPESFLYLLSALFLWTLTLPLAERWRMALAGAVLGAGIAVKVTFGSLAIVLPFVVSLRGRPLRELAATAASFTAGAATAIAALAPYALIHFDLYLNGIAALVAQYTSLHPPYSLPIYDAVSQAAWIGAYFVQLYGFAAPLALAAPFLLQGTLRYWAFALAGVWLVLFLYFASKTVFFERNFAHVLIPLLLAAALGIEAFNRTSLRVAAVMLTVFPMAYWSTRIVYAVWTPNRLAQFEAANALTAKHHVDFPQIYFGTIPGKCDTLSFHDFNDRWTRAFREALRQRGFEQIAHYRGGFGPLVTSALQTDFGADVRYFRCPPAP